MTFRLRPLPVRAIRPRSARDSGRGARMLVGVLLLATAMLGAGTTAALGEEAPEASATPPPSSTEPPSTLTITGPDGGFSPQNLVDFTGTRTAGSTVAVTADGTDGCVPAATPTATEWSCSLQLPNGPDQIVTATETLEDGTAGEPSTATVSVLGPPTIDPAPPQQSPGKASGTGYPGATITLLVDGASQKCNALVTGTGEWLCTIAGGDGTYGVQATQSVDAMGVSNPSAEQTIIVDPAPPVETPPPTTTTPAPQPAPVVPPAPTTPEADEPEPESSPSPTPHERTDAGTLPWLDRPLFPGPDGEGPSAREALTNWGTPTGFGSRLPTPTETFASSNWLWAPLLALAFIGLVAVPLRLLATSLRGRFAFRKPQFAGRNRGPAAPADAVPRNPWLMGAIPLAATAGLIVLAEGLNGEVRYLRLLFAVGVGLALLNVVGVAISSRLASSWSGVSGRLRFLPILLVIAAIATLLSRFTGMEPPLVGGVLITAGFAMGIPVRPRAVVGLTQVGGVLVLALLAWVAHGLVGAVDGFWASVLSETLATVCLAGLGSALILMLPIGALPGRVVLEWSRGAWAAAALIVATAAAAILQGGIQLVVPTITAFLVVAGFAAICVAVWAWANYVEASRA